MATPQINLTAGFVPKQKSGAIDLSSGLVPKQQPQPEVTYQQPPIQPQAPAPMIGDDGEETTPQAAARDAAYDKLPWYTKARLLTVPGAMDEWSKPFFGGQIDPEGPTAALGKVIQPTLQEMSEGSADVLEGNIAKGGHRIIKGGSLLALPFVARGLPGALVSNPLAVGGAMGGGFLGGKVLETGTKFLGGSQDQQDFANDIGNLAGGVGGAKLLPSIADARVAPLLGREVTGRIPFLSRLEDFRKPTFEEYKTALTPDPQLSLFGKTPKLGDSPLFSTSPELAKPQSSLSQVAPQADTFNGQPRALLPAGPTITPPPADTSGSVPFKPPLFNNTTRAQRLGLMLPEKATAPIELGPGEVLPPEASQAQEGVFPAASRFVADHSGNPRVQFLTSPAQPSETPVTAPPQSGQFNLPNATYLRPDMQSLSQRPPSPPEPDLLHGIREHEFLSSVQDELNRQDGDPAAEKFLDDWMAAHNRQQPGAAKGPGLMNNARANRTVAQSIEQANAQGQPTLPPDEPQAAPGIMMNARKRSGGGSAPAQATPAAQPPPASSVFAGAQPELATESNTEDLLRKSLEMVQGKKGPGLMANARQQPPTAPVQQRGLYPDLRAELDEMSPDDQQRAIFMSDKTDLPNRRAFDIAEGHGNAPAVAMSDADGLKAFNDKFGYQAGDALLKAKADALREVGVEAYHDKGDEFLYRGSSPEDLKAKLDNANNILKNKVIQVETNDGNVLKFQGAQFSYGTGENIGTAETGLKADKAAREAAGQRKRGELGGIKQIK